MRRRVFLAALAGLASALPALRASAQGSLEGTIEQVDTARSTLVIRAGETTRTARLSPQTLITIDGFPGDVRDLRPGQRATVQLAVTRGGATREDAVRVDVRTRAR